MLKRRAFSQRTLRLRSAFTQCHVDCTLIKQSQRMRSESLAALDGCDDVAMTSNGIVLHRRLPDLVNAGLSQLNLSLDTLLPQKFELMTRRRGLEAVWKTIDVAEKLLPIVKVCLLPSSTSHPFSPHRLTPSLCAASTTTKSSTS